MSMIAPNPRLGHGRFDLGPPLARPQGFTLVEVLITIVLLAVGLLGLAALQGFSLKNSHASFYRSIASQQAYDIADRISANLVGLGAGNYDNVTATLPSNPNCITSSCTPANMALTDRYQWLSTNAVVLPGGSGTVQCAVGPSGNRICNVTVSWTERAEPDSANPSGLLTQSFVTRFAP